MIIILIVSLKLHWAKFFLFLIFFGRCFGFSGKYGPNVDLNKLKDFHRRRLQVLVEAGPDLIAFETIPNKLEAQVRTFFLKRLTKLKEFHHNWEFLAWN